MNDLPPVRDYFGILSNCELYIKLLANCIFVLLFNAVTKSNISEIIGI